jgi:hypothetical protein
MKLDVLSCPYIEPPTDFDRECWEQRARRVGRMAGDHAAMVAFYSAYMNELERCRAAHGKPVDRPVASLLGIDV